jgi:hypothetical protein
MGKFLFLSVVRKQLYRIVQQGHGFLSKTKSFTGKDFPSTSMQWVYCDETDEPPRFHESFFFRLHWEMSDKSSYIINSLCLLYINQLVN